MRLIVIALALALATPLATAQESPKPKGGFDADQWNRAIRLDGDLGVMFEKRRSANKGPHKEAMHAALMWLKNNQDADGSWSAGKAGDATVATTSAALLAMLGNGSTMRIGPFKAPIKKGVNWLRRHQQPSGAFCNATGPHLIATLAMTEAYTLSSYKLLKRSATRAFNFALTRRTEDGGWRASSDATESDPALTHWGTAMVCTAAWDGYYKDANPTKNTLTWLAGSRATLAPDNGVLGAKPPLTRIGELAFDQGTANAFTLFWIKIDKDSVHPAPLIAAATKRRDAALARARKLPRKWRKDPRNKLSISEWFTSSHAFHLSGDKDALASLQKALADAQVAEGEHAGTWDPIGVWGEVGGRAWTTAMAVMTLGAQNRYGQIIGR